MLTLNVQDTEKRNVRQDGALDVVDVFHTIQGEGPFAGFSAVFVRLAGCNLQCPLCDTDYTSGRKLVTVEQLVTKIKEVIGSKTRLIVLTGGEPFRQALGPFVTKCLGEGWDIQVETNGTVYDESLRAVEHLITVVCSPKASVNSSVKKIVTDLKYVIRAGEVDENGIPVTALGSVARPEPPWEGFDGRVFIQPCDEQDPEKNKANTDLAVKLCMEKGFILCLQLHKIIGLP